MFFQRSTPTSDLDTSWAPLSPRGEIFEVEVDWVKETKDTIRRVDVREAAELRGELGAMEGAAHVALGDLATEAKTWLDKETPVVVICRSGGRSASGAAVLQQLGFTRVASMRGGMIAWRATGY